LEVGTGFHPELTGRENIFFNGSMLGMSRQEIRKKFNDIVDFSEIEKFLDTPVKFYSSGMYVRLAFAVAAHLEPEILILDEVLSVGDAQFQKKSMNKMLSIADGGCTILFVSHSMLAVEELCDRAMLLRKGRVEVIDKTENVTEKYLVGDLSPAERQAYIMTKKEHDANSQEPASEGKHSSGPQSVTEEYLTELTGELETATAVKILDENKKAAGKGARLRGTTKFVPKKLISYEGLNFSNFTINDKPFSDRLRFKSGEPIEVSFQYDSEKSVYIDIGYGIRRKNDNSLAVFTHADLENFVHKTKSSGKITAKLKLPRLAPDNYSLEFHVWVNGELVITEEKICEFAIPETKAFTSQQAFASFPSTVLVDSHWSAHN
jgi:ABC-type multidrug transport system ATPase subunit